ncbi:MAG: hypothetical protein Q4G49_06135 [Paracoccus sp. (in: a-proteobacteria)]|nr:hypothetical protein [Paracoccus sp. (in: a-proteobacteria)]
MNVLRQALAWAIIAGLLSLPVMWWNAGRASEDRDFAMTFFGAHLPVEQVLASRRWHGDWSGWGCTFAVVTLNDTAPSRPPSWVDERFRFGGAWQPAPQRTSEAVRDTLEVCADPMPPPAALAMDAALVRSDTWMARDAGGEIAMIYAPKSHLAAWVRYGD